MLSILSQSIRRIYIRSLLGKVNYFLWISLHNFIDRIFGPRFIMERTDGGELVQHRSAIFIGRRYAGKTTIFNAASYTSTMPLRDADDGTKECETSDFRVGSTLYKIIDTQGFRGDASEDFKVLSKIKREIKRNGTVSTFFIVTSFKRFEPSDTNVINFMTENLTETAKKRAYLIIMSCGNSERDKAIEQLHNQQRFQKITIFPSERILNFDLPDFNSFPEPEVRPVFQRRYENARDSVRAAMVASGKGLLLEEAIKLRVDQGDYCIIA